MIIYFQTSLSLPGCLIFINLKKHKIKKKLIDTIISGGQTGVDIAALEFALQIGINHKGFCPKGRINESGIIPQKFNLIETYTSDHQIRTRYNILSSGGTLILYTTKLYEGTEYTRSYCLSVKKPLLLVSLQNSFSSNIITLNNWIRSHTITSLNIAGPRESEENNYQKVKEFLLEWWK